MIEDPRIPSGPKVAKASSSSPRHENSDVEEFLPRDFQSELHKVDLEQL